MSQHPARPEKRLRAVGVIAVTHDLTAPSSLLLHSLSAYEVKPELTAKTHISLDRAARIRTEFVSTSCTKRKQELKGCYWPVSAAPNVGSCGRI